MIIHSEIDEIKILNKRINITFWIILTISISIFILSFFIGSKNDDIQFEDQPKNEFGFLYYIYLFCVIPIFMVWLHKLEKSNSNIRIKRVQFIFVNALCTFPIIIAFLLMLLILIYD
jgi:hypothetical protein